MHGIHIAITIQGRITMAAVQQIMVPLGADESVNGTTPLC